MKKTINKLFYKIGYQIKKKDSGFSFNPNLNWLKDYNINTVLDIGANNGQFACFANSNFPEIDILSFEPIKECHDELLKLKKTVKKLQLYKFALGNTNGKMNFFKNEFSPSSSLLNITNEHVKNFPFTNRQNTEEIDVKKLDDVVGALSLKKNILVKIDVQGYEMNVILGGERFFASEPSIVIVETSFVPLYENEEVFNDIYKKMLSLKYRFHGNLYQLYSPQDGKILQGDAVFIKN